MKSCPTCHEIFPHQFTVCPKDGTTLRAVTELAPGAVVRGKYQVIDRLGAGGMGVVYKVRHLHLDEVWALKLLASHLADDSGFLQRFRAEAVLMRRLDHPNAVRVHDFDETAEGRPFIVMEYVDGQSVEALVKGGLPLEPARALRLCVQACDGLGAAHSLGIVHRDIKPSNILVVARPDGSEQVKILDFGIAKVKEQGGWGGGPQTSTGIVVGTPDYMSPEQAQGLRGDRLDGRSDLYSLGVVLYQLLTGRLPFAADTPMMVLLARIQLEPPDPRSVRANLSAVTAQAVLRSLERNPEHRYADAATMRRALEEAFDQEDAARIETVRLTPSTVVAPAPPPSPPVVAAPLVTSTDPLAATPPPQVAPQRRPRSQTWIYATAAALVVVGVIVAAVALRYGRAGSQPVVGEARPSPPPAAATPAPVTAAGGGLDSALPRELPAAPNSQATSGREQAPIEAPGGNAAAGRTGPTGGGAGAVDSATIAPVAAAPMDLASDQAGGLGIDRGGGVLQDPTEALRRYLKAADQGDAFAQWSVGRMYEMGRGVRRDEAEALKWYRKSAEQGNPRGEASYGWMLLNGRGGPRDYAAAAKWLLAAAEQGQMRAATMLGSMYQDGQGVAKDEVAATNWFRKAAERGEPVAQNSLGVAYALGRGVPQDGAEAVKWYRKAAERGVVLAQFNLGLAYGAGRIVPQDTVEAYVWYTVAIAGGHPRATAIRSGLARQMSRREIAEAERRADVWQSQHPRPPAPPSGERDAAIGRGR